MTHSNQKIVADTIVNLHQQDPKPVVLVGQPQSGKTGCINETLDAWIPTQFPYPSVNSNEEILKRKSQIKCQKSYFYRNRVNLDPHLTQFSSQSFSFVCPVKVTLTKLWKMYMKFTMSMLLAPKMFCVLGNANRMFRLL